MNRLRWTALGALLVQAILLFSNLGLLPLWGDEYFTIHAIGQPLPEMFATLRADIHPPLYFLIARTWARLPLSGDPIVHLRMLSGVTTLAGSALAMWLLLPRLGERGRVWFCLLLATSPCLILYGRMARSYSLQLVVVILAIDQLLRLLRQPTVARSIAMGLAAALVLYTHYVPGLALVAAMNLAILWRLRRVVPLILPNAVLSIAYLPWLASLGIAASRWGGRLDQYRLTGGMIVDETIKLGFWGVSFFFGESLTWWLLALEIPLVCGLVWLAWQGKERAREWLLPVVVLAIAGYIGVSRWISYPFIPARLLFLLPFVLLLLAQGAERRPKVAGVLLSALLVTSAVGLYFYFRVENYLNWGYAVPFAEIAREAESDEPTAAVGLISDSSALSYYLPKGVPYSGVDESPERAAAELAAGEWRRILVVRQTHDSIGGFYSRFDAALGARFEKRVAHEYLPRPPLDRMLIRALGWKDATPYFYEMVEFSR